MDGRDAILAEALSLLQSPKQDALLVGFQPGLVPSPEELISFFNTLGSMTRLYLFTPSLSESGRGAVYTKFNAGLPDSGATSADPISDRASNAMEVDDTPSKGSPSNVAAAVREAADAVLSALAVAATCTPRTSPSPPDPQTGHLKKRKLGVEADAVDSTETAPMPGKAKKRKKAKVSAGEAAANMYVTASDAPVPQMEVGKINGVSNDGLSSKRNKKKKTWKTSNETESEAWTGPTSTAAQPTSTGIDQRRGYSPSVPLPFSNIVRERIRALYGELNPTVTAVDRFGIDAVELDGDNAVKERQEGEPYRTKARDRDDDDQAEVLTTITVVPTGIMSPSSSAQAVTEPDTRPVVENGRSKRSKRKREKVRKESAADPHAVAEGNDAELVRRTEDDIVLAPHSKAGPLPSEPSAASDAKESKKKAKTKDAVEALEGSEEVDQAQTKKKRKKRKSEGRADADADAEAPLPGLSSKTVAGDRASQDADQGTEDGAVAPTKVKKPKKKKKAKESGASV